MSICKNNSFSSKITLSEAPTYNDAHNDARTTPFAMSLDATFGVETRGRKRRDANAGEAIPGLLNDIVVTHILRSEYFDDPADLARLPAVSRVMRDAVAATGLRFEELGEIGAVELGCVSALKRLQRQGRLSRRERLCEAAARGVDISRSCRRCAQTAARGTQARARVWRSVDTSRCCSGRTRTGARGTRIRARSRRRAGTSRCCSGCTRTAARGLRHVRVCGNGWAPRGAAVGARERVPVRQGNVQFGGCGRAPQGAAVIARERLP